MPRGVAKSRYDFDKDCCEYENGTWCSLPKFKRCEHCLRCIDGSKACEVTAL